jgi:hypothetical protein
MSKIIVPTNLYLILRSTTAAQADSNGFKIKRPYYKSCTPLLHLTLLLPLLQERERYFKSLPNILFFHFFICFLLNKAFENVSYL